MKAIHNKEWLNGIEAYVVPNIKDTNYWKQFTTISSLCSVNIMLFRISKILIIESNSQLSGIDLSPPSSCSEYQRY